MRLPWACPLRPALVALAASVGLPSVVLVATVALCRWTISMRL
ncbi:MAG TPA: hypothetical protein QGH28_06600 [Chloroflexota bacterium]|nr:hypothetical protein [Chloroflexota bacterium]